MYDQSISPIEMDEHIATAEQWLSAIELGITPEGVQYSYETISTRFQNVTDEPVELPATALELVNQLRHVKAEAASYKQLEDKLKAELCQLIGPSQVATIGGETVATWKSFNREFFDVKRFQAEQPALAEKYTKKTQSRTLRLKGDK